MCSLAGSSSAMLQLPLANMLCSISTLILSSVIYGWIPHNASFGFLDLAPSILHSNWFWDYIS
jgi:hypothetical protein